MGFWAWFWIWTGLVLASLVTFGFIAKSLFNRLGSAAHQANRMAERLIALNAKISEKPVLEPVENSVLADPVIAISRRKALQKVRIKKREQRQRRLIANLKHFDPNESRFH